VYDVTRRLCGEDDEDDGTTTTTSTKPLVDVMTIITQALSDDVRPLRADPRAFTTFISRLCRAKQYTRALEVFDAQKACGVERTR